MKRLLTLLLAVLMLAALTATAQADLLYIPDDPFYNQHIRECHLVERSYRAMTDVTVYESPESDKVMWTIPEGKTCHIYASYHSPETGYAWGLCEKYDENDRPVQGWVPMAYMKLMYDERSFAEDYRDQFDYEDVLLDEAYLGQTIRLWTYPGSEYSKTTAANEYIMEYYMTYTDPDGRRWGCVWDMDAKADLWVCLDDPCADFDTLYPDGAPDVEPTRPGESAPTLPAEQIVPQPSAGTKALRLFCTIAVAFCVIITGSILVQMKRETSKNNKEESI